jgi:hypothetical protein
MGFEPRRKIESTSSMIIIKGRKTTSLKFNAILSRKKKVTVIRYICNIRFIILRSDGHSILNQTCVKPKNR